MNTNSLDTSQISEKLITHLQDELENPAVDYLANLQQIQGGYETKIFRFQLKGVPAEFSQTLVLRLYPEFYGIHNAIWESKIQNVLAGTGYPVPKVHFLCTDMSILGGAFFIMDCIPGQPLMFAAATLETVPEILGETHAELHQIEPATLIKELDALGIDERGWSLKARFDRLREKAAKFPWISEGIDWLFDNRPSEPAHLSVCHGDFHPLNILVDDGAVTGVLDWAGFAIADPAFDVANTLVLTTIPVKHLTEIREGFPAVDWDLAAEVYISAYRTRKELDRTNLDYYRVRRCLRALIEGFEGQKIWQHPLIVRDLVDYIQKITDVQIRLPESTES